MYGWYKLHFDNILGTGRSFTIALKTGKSCQHVAPIALGSPTNSYYLHLAKIFYVQDTVMVSVCILHTIV